MSENNDTPHTTLDDCDVNWQYGGDTWGTNHTDDPLVDQYQHGTFYSTTVHGAWARLCWTGTNVEVLGAKRKNHGLYTVSVDNGELTWLNGQSDKDQIKSSLYQTQGLEWGNHQIVLTNMPKINMTKKDHVWFDIDYAEIDGWPIDCKDLPEQTVIPSGTVAPPITYTSFPTSSVSSLSNSTTPGKNSTAAAGNSTIPAGNSTVPAGNSTGNSTLSGNSTLPGNSTANSTSTILPNNSTINSTATLTKAPLASSNSTATLLNSTSSAIDPTTTVMMSSPPIENSASAGLDASASSSQSTSSGFNLQPGGEGHLALIGLMGIYFFKWVF